MQRICRDTRIVNKHLEQLSMLADLKDILYCGIHQWTSRKCSRAARARLANREKPGEGESPPQ